MSSPAFDREIASTAAKRSSMGALTALGEIDWAPCPYPAHRASDWRLRGGGPVTCGVCHPPASPRLNVVAVAP